METTTVWNVLDLETGEQVGQAPGTGERSALAAFQRDALNGAGEIVEEMHYTAIHVGDDRYAAENPAES